MQRRRLLEIGPSRDSAPLPGPPADPARACARPRQSCSRHECRGAPVDRTSLSIGIVSIRLGALRLGDAYMGMVNSEAYSAIAQRLKRESPFKHTLMSTLTNGFAPTGYIPSDDAFGRNVFQVLSSRLKPGCAEAGIVNGIVAMMRGLWRASHCALTCAFDVRDKRASRGGCGGSTARDRWISVGRSPRVERIAHESRRVAGERVGASTAMARAVPLGRSNWSRGTSSADRSSLKRW